MSDFFYGSICLSDIPKELFKKADNGKVYLNIAVAERREVSQYGQTHNVIASRPKGEDGDTIYIGNLKKHEQKVLTPESIQDAPVASDEDLPF